MSVEKIAKLSSSSRSAAFGALILIGAIALYNWIVAPHVTYLHAVQRYEPTVDVILDEKKATIAALAGKKKRVEKLREQASQLRRTLFTHEKGAEFFSDLQTIAEEAGCVVNSVNFGAGGSRPSARQSDIALHASDQRAMLNVVGTYDQITGLARRLQARTQNVWIDALDMTSFSMDSARIRCDMTITICTIDDEEARLNE
ncbi:MAG: hypothetical protein JSU70_11785 [Phycisphaerales bacterium]|nr:MAG: hypothetical protein JSU70_11785 [Phycisphaerales bacterium]